MNEREVLEELLASLIKSYNTIEKKLALYEEDDDAKYNRLLNNQMKVARSIQNCISLLRDPRRQILPGKIGRNELAKMMEFLDKAEKKENLLTDKSSRHSRKISMMQFKN